MRSTSCGVFQIPSNPCHLSLPTESPLCRARFVHTSSLAGPQHGRRSSSLWPQEHSSSRSRSGGARRRWHPRPRSSTSLPPSAARACSPPPPSSARPWLPLVVLTRPPVVLLFSSLSNAGAARCRGGRRAVEAGALEHIPAEGHRAVQAAPLRELFRRLRAASGRGGHRMALLALSVVASVKCALTGKRNDRRYVLHYILVFTVDFVPLS